MFGLPPLPRTLAAALRDAGHSRPHVRASALRDLVRHSRTDERSVVIDKLREVLAHDADVNLRADAAMALADADAREARPALIAAAEAGAPRLRQMAVLALGEVAEPGDAEVVPVLQAAWAAPEPAVRFQALVALHHVARETTDKLLYEAMNDPDAEIRAMAYRIADERFDDQPPPKHVVGAAEQALRDSDKGVQICAAILLAALGDRRGAPILLQAAAGALRAGTEADQQAAIELCARLELDGAIQALEKRAFGPFGLRNDSLSWHAHVALARLGHERARQVILRGLRGWTRDTRTLSVVAAGRAHLADARPVIATMSGNPARADPDAVAQALEELAGAAPADSRAR